MVKIDKNLLTSGKVDQGAWQNLTAMELIDKKKESENVRL
jgi:hypothetical protein